MNSTEQKEETVLTVVLEAIGMLMFLIVLLSAARAAYNHFWS